MKRKIIIALAAILTISLMLAGCTAWVAPVGTTDEQNANGYAGERESAYSNGARGENTTAGSEAFTEVGNGGNGNRDADTVDSCDPVYDASATADTNYTLTSGDQTLSLAGYGSEGALDDEALTLADMLTYAIQDEYLARAEYDWIIGSFGSVRPFTNIMRAEETHIEALLPLFEAYGIASPADEGESHTAAVASLTEAYQAGVNAEVNNIAMYETFLDQDLPDNVRAVFESLMRASENHLRAFQNRL